MHNCELFLTLQLHSGADPEHNETIAQVYATQGLHGEPEKPQLHVTSHR